MNSCCAGIILAAETECGTFVSATQQLFGDAVEFRAGYLWVEALDAESSFPCRDSDLRTVTIRFPDLSPICVACATATIIQMATEMQPQPIARLWRAE